VNITVGRGSPIDFMLAYGFGVLIFVMLLGALGVGLWWIIAGVKDRIVARKGRARVSYIIGTTIITILFLGAVWITTHPLK
jgi:uncharacterized Tic20 family protein